jgi:hypothetical protein
MYRYGHRPTHRFKRLLPLIIVLVLLLVSASYLAAHKFLKSNTSLAQAPALVTKVGASDEKKQTVAGPTFSLKLPANWKEEKVTQTLYTIYRWHGTSTDDKPRWLEVFVDKIPLQLPVNQMLPVQAAGDRLTILNTVSDNCANFTGTTSNPKPESAPAKWSGLDFTCDLLTTTHNVTGTSSSEGINRVTLTGDKGTHKYFFVYTDNSSQPDYAILTEALQSFRAL